jgi:hypothetical protein
MHFIGKEGKTYRQEKTNTMDKDPMKSMVFETKTLHFLARMPKGA